MEKSEKIQLKYVRLYETAKYCMLVIDSVYGKLENNISDLNKNTDEKAQKVSELYIDIYSLIDFYHRFDQIIDALPLITNKRHELKQLHSVLENVKNCRNYFQHIRQHLCKDEIIDYPILGSFSWINENKNYIIIPTQTTDKHGTAGIAYDTIKMKYVCEYKFSIGSYEIKLDIIYSEVKKFWNWLESVSVIEPKEIKKYEWGVPNIICTFFSDS